MKTDTHDKVLNLIRTKAQVRPFNLARELNISLVATHKHLKKLVEEKLVEKVGKPPLVFYRPTGMVKAPEVILGPKLISVIEKNYLYIDPQGRILTGVSGFWQWCVQTKQEKNIKKLAEKYLEGRLIADTHYAGKQWIDATDKIKSTFTNVFVDRVLYCDFYSLPQFGKTRLGQLVLHAKQAQNRQIIQALAKEIKPVVKKISDYYNIETVGFIPHSIPRTLPFLRELEIDLALPIPRLDIVKAYIGEIPIAQKTLGKLDERIINARESIFVNEKAISYKRVLLIDDAVGSGATLNETAKKLKQVYGVSYVVGFAIVGSMKGFDIIREI